VNAAPAIALRPRSAIEIIDVAVEVVRGHFVALFTLAAAMLVPAVALELVATTQAQRELWDVLNTFVGAILDTLASGAIIAYVASHTTGPPLSTAGALRAALERFWQLFAGSIVYGLMVLVGLVLLIVPGILLAARYFAIPAVIMIEGAGVPAAMSRSVKLTDGSTGRTIAIFGTAWVVYLVAMFAVQVAAEGLFSGRTQVLVTGVVQAALHPFLATLTTLLYFDLRVRREGFDVAAMLGSG
jgi:hypothetical protein